MKTQRLNFQEDRSNDNTIVGDLLEGYGSISRTRQSVSETFVCFRPQARWWGTFVASSSPKCFLAADVKDEPQVKPANSSRTACQPKYDAPPVPRDEVEQVAENLYRNDPVLVQEDVRNAGCEIRASWYPAQYAAIMKGSAMELVIEKLAKSGDYTIQQH
jgi:hypothetical protein